MSVVTMAMCQKCGFAMDRTAALPAQCPRCGTPTQSDSGPPVVGLGDLMAPPAFGEETPAGSTVTLYGSLPEESRSAESSNFDSLPVDDDFSSGPPAIELNRSGQRPAPDDLLDANARDPDTFGELDLPLPDDDSSPDLPGIAPGRSNHVNPFAPPNTAAAPPVIQPIRGLRSASSTPNLGDRESEGHHDLPAAARPSASPFPAPGHHDLPAAARPSAPPFPAPGHHDLPAAARPSASPFPAPGHHDLPAAARPSASPFPAPGHHDLPAAARPSASSDPGAPAAPFDLPRPARPGDSPFQGGVPTPISPASDSATVDLPLPSRPSGGVFAPIAPAAPTSTPPTAVPKTPSPGAAKGPPPLPSRRQIPPAAPRMPSFGQAATATAQDDLPTPVTADDLDLLEPQSDLPTPARVDLLQPAALEVEPVGIGLLAPASLDVEPADRQLTPAAQELQPAQARPVPGEATDRAGEPDHDSEAASHLDPLKARRSPTPRQVGRVSGKRLGWVALGGVATLGVVAGTLYSTGFFDPPLDAEVGMSARAPAKPNQPDQPQPQAHASEFNAALAEDTPGGYAKALSLATEAGDALGQAEASLLLDVRYGPNPLARQRAQGWLAPQAKQTDELTRRVVGLAALADGRLADAEAALVGDEPRTRLYRGWLELRQGDDEAAAKEAEAILSVVPTELGALALRHQARAAIDPQAELSAIEASLAAHPSHPGLLTAGVRVAMAAGQLRKASQWLAAAKDKAAVEPEQAPGLVVLAAELATAAGAHTRAAARYGEAATLVPGSLTLRRAQAEALLAAGELLQASQAAEAVLQDHPDDLETIALKAKIDVASGEGDEALSLAQTIDAKAPDRAEGPFLIGKVHAMRLQVDEARNAFASALARDPGFFQASIADAELLAKVDRLDEALGVLDGARKEAAKQHARADEVGLLTAKARLLAKAGRGEVAVATLDQALTVDPASNSAQLERGLLQLELGAAQKGRADLLAVYERTGAYAGLTAPLGRIFAREGDLAKLEALVAGVGETADATVEELVVLAQLHLAQGKPEQAAPVLQRALSISPNDWEANLLLAQAQLDSGHPAEALNQIDRSAPATPNAQKYLLRGKILEHNGRHDEARPEYLRALQVDESLLEARFLYGRLLAYAGEARAAADELEQVVAKTDKYPAAWLNLGRAERELANPSKALADLQKSLALDPSLVEAHYLIGRIHFEQNDMAKAATALTRAVAADDPELPWLPDALLFLGRAQSRLGQAAAAKQSLTRFLAIAPPNHSGREGAKRELAQLR